MLAQLFEEERKKGEQQWAENETALIYSSPRELLPLLTSQSVSL